MIGASRRGRAWIAAGLAAAVAVAITASVVTAQWIHRDGNFGAVPGADRATVSVDLVAYWAVSLALVGLYAGLVVVVRRGGLSGRAGLGLVAGAFAVQLGLVLTPPLFSTDVLSYVGHGATSGLGAGANAYSVHPSVLVDTPVGLELLARGWSVPPGPSPYGGLWSGIEIAIDALVGDLWGRILAYRVVAIAASGVAAAAIWWVLGRVRPADRVVGVVAFAWNPIVVFELAMEGHNDALMTAFALLAVGAAVAGRTATSIVAVAAGGLVKYVPLALAPALIVYEWRAASAARRPAVARGLILGMIGAAVLAVVAFAPFWSSHLFDGLSVASDRGDAPSLTGFVAFLLSGTSLDALRPVSGVAVIAFAVAVVVLSLGVRDAPSLFRATAAIALLFVLGVSPVFYPWYLALPIGLLALTPSTRALALVVVLALVGRMPAPLIDIRADLRPFQYADWVVTLVGVTLAGLVALWAGRERPPGAERVGQVEADDAGESVSRSAALGR